METFKLRDPVPEAGAPDVEVTPAMIEVGARVIFDLREDYAAWSLAEEIYRAMERAKTDQQH